MKISKKQTNRNKIAEIKEKIGDSDFIDTLFETEVEITENDIKERCPSIFEAAIELKNSFTIESIELLKSVCKICNVRVKVYDDCSCKFWIDIGRDNDV